MFLFSVLSRRRPLCLIRRRSLCLNRPKNGKTRTRMYLWLRFLPFRAAPIPVAYTCEAKPLSKCPESVATCYGCYGSLKPNGVIPPAPQDLVALSFIQRSIQKPGTTNGGKRLSDLVTRTSICASHALLNTLQTSSWRSSSFVPKSKLILSWCIIVFYVTSSVINITAKVYVLFVYSHNC